MGKLLLVVALVAVLAIAFPLCFPGTTQRWLFTAIFYQQKLQLTYFPEPNSPPDRSPGARALQKILSAQPVVDFQLPEELRAHTEKFGDIIPLASDAIVTRANITNELYGYWIQIRGEDEEVLNSGPVILYLHGGGYIAGSIHSHAGFVAELTRRVHGKAFFVEYRLAPEYPLPAATEDAVAAYKWLIANQKINPKRISIVGDSAGGGLTLLTLLALNEKPGALPIPGAAVTFSALTDMAMDLSNLRPSYIKNLGKDMLGDPAKTMHTLKWISGYDEPEKRKHPKFSPMYANLEGVKFPPLMMQCGGEEMIEDDSVHFYGKAQQAGLDVTLRDYKYMIHVFQAFYPYLEEADAALTEAAEFIRKHTS